MRLIGFKEDKKTNGPTFIYNSENLEIEESNVDPEEEDGYFYINTKIKIKDEKDGSTLTTTLQNEIDVEEIWLSLIHI